MGTKLTIATGESPILARVSGHSLDEISDACLAERCQRAHQAGREEAIRELSGGAGQALDEAARRIDVARQEAEREVGSFAIELSVEIASMLLRREVDAGHYDIERIVREALAASGVGRAPCTIHLAPSDLERIEATSFRAGTTLEADPHLAPGDVHVTTPQGLLVRELEACLGSIRGALFGELD